MFFVSSGVQLDLGGLIEQSSGTALYASMTYAGVLFLWPRLTPPVAGVIALAWCWGAEFFQLTGIPAALSARSLLARLVLGSTFNAPDLFWYVVGVALVAVPDAVRTTAPPPPGSSPSPSTANSADDSPE